MNIQLERIRELVYKIKLNSIEDKAVELYLCTAKKEWHYLLFLDNVMLCEVKNREIRKQNKYTRMQVFQILKHWMNLTIHLHHVYQKS